MSKDTIYREDAILAMVNALWHYPNDCYKNLNVYEFAKALAELGLRSLPSAQPECPKAYMKIKVISAVDGEDLFCENCDAYCLSPSYNFCPKCGVEFIGVRGEQE